MQRLLRRACHAANLARERGAPLKPSLIALTERRYDAVLAEGMAFHEAQTPLARPVTGGRKPRGRAPRRTGHNLLLRLATRKQDTLRFLRDPTVPFTNNQAERDGRTMKLRQKISGGFRSVEGAVLQASLKSDLILWLLSYAASREGERLPFSRNEASVRLFPVLNAPLGWWRKPEGVLSRLLISAPNWR
jgi:hypothetical protein